MSPIYDAEALAVIEDKAQATNDLPPLPPEQVREKLASDTQAMQWCCDAI